jgi:hypothetical protein
MTKKFISGAACARAPAGAATRARVESRAITDGNLNIPVLLGVI